MNAKWGLGPCLTLALAASLAAADYRVEILREGPPVEDLAAEIAQELESEGVRLIRGSTATYCDIWLCKEPAAVAGFSPSAEIQYPFQPGQLIGVARFSRRGADFRDQKVPEGVYTIRYALQPQDGSHVGTFSTRDFLLLAKAVDDKSAGIVADSESLHKRSSAAVETSHPAMFPLVKPTAESGQSPTLTHDEDHDWWILQGQMRVKVNDVVQPLDLAAVVVGVAEE